MLNKYVAFGCISGYLTAHIDVSKFAFPLDYPNLLIHWIKFVYRSNWRPTKNSLLCINHFKGKFIHYGKKNMPKWHLNPIPIKHSTEALKRPSALPTSALPLCKHPRFGFYKMMNIQILTKKNVVFKFEDITDVHCPDGFQCFQDENLMIPYKINFDQSTNFPVVAEAIEINQN